MGKLMLEVLAKDWELVPPPVLWHHSERGPQAWGDMPAPPGQCPEPMLSEPCRVFSRVTGEKSRAVLGQPRALHGLPLSWGRHGALPKLWGEQGTGHSCPPCWGIPALRGVEVCGIEFEVSTDRMARGGLCPEAGTVPRCQGAPFGKALFSCRLLCRDESETGAE